MFKNINLRRIEKVKSVFSFIEDKKRFEYSEQVWSTVAKQIQAYIIGLHGGCSPSAMCDQYSSVCRRWIAVSQSCSGVPLPAGNISYQGLYSRLDLRPSFRRRLYVTFAFSSTAASRWRSVFSGPTLHDCFAVTHQLCSAVRRFVPSTASIYSFFGFDGFQYVIAHVISTPTFSAPPNLIAHHHVIIIMFVYWGLSYATEHIKH